MPYKLLGRFRELFEGKPYIHRDSTLGDSVAERLYHDLLDLGRSAKFAKGVSDETHALNRKNRRIGVHARRGDGTFGERVPGTDLTAIPASALGVGDIATVEIGVEVKIMAKAMLKQLDRVGEGIEKQAGWFRTKGGNPICVAIIGVNYAEHASAYEGKDEDGKDKITKTNGRNHRHPIQEAAQAERRLVERVRDKYDEIIVLRYKATNEAPFVFEWLDETETSSQYGAALVRISREYDRRF